MAAVNLKLSRQDAKLLIGVLDAVSAATASTIAPSRCRACLDVAGKDGLGRPCATCSGAGIMVDTEFIKRARALAERITVRRLQGYPQLHAARWPEPLDGVQHRRQPRVNRGTAHAGTVSARPQPTVTLGALVALGEQENYDRDHQAMPGLRH